MLRLLEQACIVFALLLVLANDLRGYSVRCKFRTHAAALNGITTARHRTRGVDELALQRDHTPTFLSTKRNPVGLVQVVGDESVRERLVERGREAGLLRFDEIEETRYILWSLNLVHTAIAEFVEDDERRPADLLATEVLDASLTLLDGVHDHVAELTTGSGDSHIILVGDGSQTSQTPLQSSRQLISLL